MFNWHKQLTETKKPLTLGQQGELWAQKEYEKGGYKIISSNEYNKKGKRAGEIDFIATKNKHLIFVEVKTRTLGVSKFGTGAEAVNWSKQIKLLKAVKMFLSRNVKYRGFIPQIDVCVVEVDPVRDPISHDIGRRHGRLISNGVDKPVYSVKIITNAVEDWN